MAGCIFNIKHKYGDAVLLHGSDTITEVDKSVQCDSDAKKQPYCSPAVAKLTVEQAVQFVSEHTDHSEQQAIELLESLRQELQQNGK